MRKLLLLSIVLSTGLLFMGRLFYLQIYDTSAVIKSENNAIKVEYDYPQRGHIYDIITSYWCQINLRMILWPSQKI